MDLHLNYEGVELYPLDRETFRVLPQLIASRETGVIEVDTVTAPRGVPAAAWDDRLGTYSALEWVLERYKEKKPKEPVIELVGKMCAVRVKTMEIVGEMPE